VLFTDLGIRRLKPPKEGQVLIWDTAQKGLALLVSPGGTKAFRSTFKLNGKWVSRTLGRFDEVVSETNENANIAWAREQCRQDRSKAKAGIDPAAKKPITKTFRDVVADYIEGHAKRTQRTWQQTERVLLHNCAPLLDLEFKAITKDDVNTLLKKFEDQGHEAKAGLTFAWLSSLWRWAYREELTDNPIMQRVRRPATSAPRDRVYSDDEIKAIWAAAEQCKPTEAAFVKLLVLLAPRITALAQMRWSHFDATNNVWVTPNQLTKSSKNRKDRTYKTPLPPLAARILTSLPRGGNADDPVFPDLFVRVDDQGYFAPYNLVSKLKRNGAPPDFSPHAIRHTLATFLENAGHSEWERAQVLNHSGSSVTAGYSHGHPLELKRQLYAKWSDHIEQLVSPPPLTDNVIPLRA
jgi:integrase